MAEIDLLGSAIESFARIGEENFALSLPFWQQKQYGKGEFHNEYKNVCRHLGFIIDRVFRAYYINEETTEEKNVFFLSRNQILVAYKSFVTQTPCNYYTASMADSAMTRAEDFMFLRPEQRYLGMIEKHPDIYNNVPLYHIASYLGIQGPFLSRIRNRMTGK